VTLVTRGRENLFGQIIESKVSLSEFGRIAFTEWIASKLIRQEIYLSMDEFIVMPNHIHGIVWIKFSRETILQPQKNAQSTVGATGRSPLPSDGNIGAGLPSKSLGAFIAGYKSAVTFKINKIRNMKGISVWMTNYHDRIIRDEVELNTFRLYIQENPLKWELDQYYPFSNS
jgi:REP element-mobilizing transposase RayT